MIIFFMLIFMTTTKATEDTKYIDLLPEKQKEIFLEKVARRIHEEVDTNPSKQKSGEVPNDELDVHDEFVKKILREEEANFRKNNNNDTNDISVKPLERTGKVIDLTLRSRTRRNSVENLRKSFDADSDFENNNSDVKKKFTKDSTIKSDEKDIEIKHFDLESQDNPKVKLKVNDDDVKITSTEQATAVETEKPTTENQDNAAKETNNTSDLSDATKSKITNKTNSSLLVDLTTTSTTKAEENKYSLKSIESENVDENQKENKPFVTENANTEKQNIKRQINEKENTTEQVKDTLRQKNVTFLDISIQTLRERDTVKNVEETSTVSTTVKIYTDKVTEIEETRTETNKSEFAAKENVKRDVNAAADKEINDSEIKESSGKNYRINTVNFGNINTDKSKIIPTDVNHTNNNLFIDLESTPPSKNMRVKPEEQSLVKNADIVSASSDKIDTFSKDNVPLTTQDKIVKENVKGALKSESRNIKSHNTDSKNVKRVVEHEFEATTQEIEVLTPLIPLTSKYNTNKKEKLTNKLDTNIIQVLRDVIERNKIRLNGKLDGLKAIHKVKEHNVYEIPKADKEVILDDTSNREQPYYYPIYKYSPNNAYYNAHNKFGPNQDDQDDHRIKNQEQEYLQSDSINTNNNNRGFRSGNIESKEHINNNFLFNLPVVQYLTNSYTDDENPDIARNKKTKIKDQSEEDNLKNTVRHIRLHMFAHKQFGYIPDKVYSSIETDSSNSSESSAQTVELKAQSAQSCLRDNFEAILKRELRSKEKHITNDNSDIVVDYYFSDTHDKLKPNKVKSKKDRSNDLNKITDALDKIFNKNKYKLYVVDPAYSKSRINKKYLARDDEDKRNLEKLQQSLSIGSEHDVLPTLNPVVKMDKMRSSEERDVEIYVDVLADLIQTDNEALVKYDWLETTVNIHGATLKLLELTQLVLLNKFINPSDLELLKYSIYLYKEASTINQFEEASRTKLPRGKHMKRKIIKTHGLLNRIYLVRESRDVETNMYKLTKEDVENFREFLDELLNSLFDLHTAIKEIASITKYFYQNWFKNLKELYLDRTRNKTLQVLLHLTANRVLDLLENSAKNGLENDYKDYMRRNKKEVNRTKDEFLFLIKILNEIKNDK